jgi:CRP-like cAMP-binding protein
VPKAVVSQRNIELKDKQMIKDAINSHFLFSSIQHHDENQDLIIHAMKHYQLSISDLVFEQGQPAQNFYIVISGILEILVNGRRIKTLTKGMTFGELALINNSPRTATVRCM